MSSIRTSGLVACGFALLAAVGCRSLPGIHQAARAGELVELRRLLDAGTPVDLPSGYGDTPLAWAAGRGQLAVVEELLKRGANPNAINPRRRTALFVTCQAPIMDALLKAGAAPSFKDVFDVTPLHEAFRCTGNESSVVKLLLRAGAEPNAADTFGWTPLHVAAQFGDSAATRLLLDGGAAVNPLSGQGVTPMDVARLTGQSDALALIAQRGGVSTKFPVRDTTSGLLVRGENTGNTDGNLLRGSSPIKPGFHRFSYTVKWWNKAGFGRALVDIGCYVFTEPRQSYVVDTHGGVSREATLARIKDKATGRLVGGCVY